MNATSGAAGEPYFTTYQAVGPVLLAVMSADSFHACTDRAIANKTHSRGSTEGEASGGVVGLGDTSRALLR